MVFQVRSLDEDKHNRYIGNVLEACERAAADLDGHVEHEVLGKTRGFRFAENDRIVERAKSAICSAGLQSTCTVSCGGSDANEFNAKGMATLVLSVGYQDIHSNKESMPIVELNNLARVCSELMLGK